MEPLDVNIRPRLMFRTPESMQINGFKTEFYPKVRRGPHQISDVDDHLYEMLAKYTLRELQNKFVQIRPTYIRENTPFVSFGGVTLWERRDVQAYYWDDRPFDGTPREYPELFFYLHFDMASWSRGWTLRDHVIAMKSIVENSPFRESIIMHTADPARSFTVGCMARSLDSLLGDEVQHWQNLLSSIESEATSLLEARQKSESLITAFRFPPSVSTACEQYLLYFVQFLQDLGIDVEGEVQHRAADVLFRVTPINGKTETLKRIREALDIYLDLPSNPTFEEEASQLSDVAVRHLEFSVHQLKSQLALARMFLDTKDATIRAQLANIEALELSNFRLRQLRGHEPQSLPSGISMDAKEQDIETVIPGIVSVKDVEKAGIVLHTPEIIRKLKRRLS